MASCAWLASGTRAAATKRSFAMNLNMVFLEKDEGSPQAGPAHQRANTVPALNPIRRADWIQSVRRWCEMHRAEAMRHTAARSAPRLFPIALALVAPQFARGRLGFGAHGFHVDTRRQAVFHQD